MSVLPKKRWPYALAATLATAYFVAPSFRIVDDPRPVGTLEDVEALAQRDDLNLLFVLVDTLRADRLGSYGYARDTSPTMDALASTGIRFAKHLAQASWTKASMASLWTSLYPQRSGVTRFDSRLSEEARLPAEVLRDAGFQTAGIWRNGWVSGYFGFDQGFDVYYSPRSRAPPASVRRENPTISVAGTDMDAVDAAREFARVNVDKRFFLYVHLMDVHEYLYDSDSALFGTAFSDIYDNAIRRENAVLDQLMRVFDDADLLDRTLVVVASDHGEAFGERGLEGHARAVFRESTEVPLLISMPFRLESGIVVKSRTANVDIWPTLFDLLGIPHKSESDGRSRLPEILAAGRGEAPPGDDQAAIAHLDTTWGRRGVAPAPTVAVARGPLRFVVMPQSGRRPAEHLFDADEDPSELENLLGQKPEDAAALRALAAEYLARTPPWSTPETLELNELQLNQLRALGYSLP
jgi:arylsulfatase A-like enzyme